jgi:peptide/nickel transport system permease protein
MRRLRRNRVALAFLGLFFLIVVFVLAAPLWSKQVAETGPNDTHTLERVTVNGEKRDVVTPEGKPIGPLWFGAGGKYFLGADGRLGRDEMVRLMYGGRTSLFIGIVSALITTLLAVVLGLLGGYYGGWIDAVISRTLDVIWAFPVLLLGIALGTVLAVGGLKLGPLELSGSSIWIPILIIGVVYAPYMARPIRGEVLALREKEFVEAAVAQGAGPLRVMFGELLPNLLTTIVVFLPLNIANNMLLEAGLSFLGAGVQPPNSSWGSMISSAFDLISSSPLLTILPGTMILLTVLSLNVFGDGLRDALDPKSKVRLEARAGIAEPEGTPI